MAHHESWRCSRKKTRQREVKTKKTYTTHPRLLYYKHSWPSRPVLSKKQKSILIRKTAKPFYNKSLINQACSVKMAGYKPRSFFPAFTDLDFVSVYKKAKMELG